MKKLLASDYDGTLKFGAGISDEDREAIQKWQNAGHVFAIVTGRSKESIFEQIDENSIRPDYIVTNNGGMVWDGEGNNLMGSQLDVITAIDLIYLAHEFSDVVSLMVNDGDKRHKLVINPNMVDHRYAHRSPDMSEEEVMNSKQFGQIVYSMRDPMAAISMADNLNQYFGNQITAYANNFVVDIVPNGISKATGLQFVQEYADVSDDDTYAIGDSRNDIPMLEGCLNSAAFVLSEETVQDAAQRTVDSFHDFVEEILTEA